MTSLGDKEYQGLLNQRDESCKIKAIDLSI